MISNLIKYPLYGVDFGNENGKHCRVNSRDDQFIKAFGERLRSLRQERSLSQEALYLKTDLSKNQIGRIERGEVNTTLATIKVLADALGVEPFELLKG